MTTNFPEETPEESIPGEEFPKPVENTPIEKTESIAPPSEPVKPEIAAKETPRPPWIPSFHGEGSKFFVIQLINTLLRIITFNFYYPWAKAAKLRYLYEQTEFAKSRFVFHGTGKEIFIGYIKLLLIIVAVGLTPILIPGSGKTILIFFIAYGILIVLYPVAIHGTIKYRLSRTSWRGIFFGYHGELGELIGKFFFGLLLSVLTLSIYWSWVQVDIRKYVTSNIRFGNVEFEFTGSGTDLFLIKLKYGVFLFIGSAALAFMMSSIVGERVYNMPGEPTDVSVDFFMEFIGRTFLTVAFLALIALMRQRELFQFYVDNTKILQNDRWHEVTLHMSLADLFVLSLTNTLLLIFTLGIATPFVEIRNLHFIMPRLVIEGTFDPDALIQTEKDFRDATGEDLGDWLDIDLA